LRYPEDRECPDLLARVLDYPWGGLRNEKIQASYYCSDIERQLLDVLGRELNSQHAISFDMRGWNMMLGPWLHRLVTTAYLYYVCLERAECSQPKFETIGLDRSAYITPTTSANFFQFLWEDFHNLQLMTDLIRGMGFSFSERMPEKGDFQFEAGGARPSYMSRWRPRSRLRRALSKGRVVVFRALARHADCVLYDASPNTIEAMRLMMSSWLRIVPLPIFIMPEEGWPLPNNTLRERLKMNLVTAFCQADRFVKILAENLINYLPISYLEGFSRLGGLVDQYFPAETQRICSSMSWIADDAFALWCVRRSAKKALLIGAQHGGGYGMKELVGGSEYAERQNVDRFLSWGPAIRLGHDCFAVPPPPHFRLNLPSVSAERLLYVGGTGMPMPWGFSSSPEGPEIYAYIARQVAFLQALPADLMAKCLVRPNPSEYGCSERQILSDAVCDIRFDDFSAGFVGRLAETRLAVVDNLNTTFFQCFSSGIPTLLVWDPDVWSVTPLASNYFKELEAAGVFFACPLAAAKKAEEVWADPIGWWSSKSVKFAVENFLANYYLKDGAWLTAWKKALLD
jgi:putative transferase (TIGR04331 family)